MTDDMSLSRPDEPASIRKWRSPKRIVADRGGRPRRGRRARLRCDLLLRQRDQRLARRTRTSPTSPRRSCATTTAVGDAAPSDTGRPSGTRRPARPRRSHPPILPPTTGAPADSALPSRPPATTATGCRPTRPSSATASRRCSPASTRRPSGAATRSAALMTIAGTTDPGRRHRGAGREHHERRVAPRRPVHGPRS